MLFGKPDDHYHVIPNAARKMKHDWYEVWVSDSTDIPYVLLLLHDSGSPDEIVVVDPKEGDKIVYASVSYEEAKLWLLEDEFTLADGRMDD